MRELFDVHTGPKSGRKVLNTLNLPNFSALPKEDKIGLDERIWKAVNFIYGFRQELFPAHSVNWFRVGLSGACQGWHGSSEGFGTFIAILSGMKWLVVARNGKTHEKLDFFVETPDFYSWSVRSDWDVEGILLTPGTRM